ncbi:nuclear envelope phosphatase-regulatory subunit 1-like isoform X3 [Diabrotica virgifera virgifera]|uniref:Transmembrane protein 188 n=1 Tax=Diabrotica virgifera virgifera TaxID=50390 RepID=A0A6P7GWU9_DIAVI|nr:nuclear envelope phosphatase-regulatory subunit 1-like isoform X3 [Diabrotica virgifera virgifera]
MSLEQTACEVVLLGVSLCVATGASQWILDPETRIVSLSQSLTNHPFFILSTVVLIVILLLGVHKRVIASSIITSRTREVLGDFNMSCDDSGKLILRPRPTNIT